MAFSKGVTLVTTIVTNDVWMITFIVEMFCFRESFFSFYKSCASYKAYTGLFTIFGPIVKSYFRNKSLFQPGLENSNFSLLNVTRAFSMYFCNKKNLTKLML
jgi:hypothetical protein